LIAVIWSNTFVTPYVTVC